MELYRKRRVDYQYNDERGSLTQLIHCGYQQINVLESKEGVIRGAHFHRRSVEAFFVIAGSVRVEFRGKGEEKKVIFSKGDFFEIPALVLHTMYFLDDCLMVQMYDNPVENVDGSKDIFGEEEFYARN